MKRRQDEGSSQGHQGPGCSVEQRKAFEAKVRQILGMSLNEALLGVKTPTLAWMIFSRLVLPKDASDVQRREMRRAFMAGCDWVLKRLLAEKGDEQEHVQLFESMRKDLEEFQEGISDGRH